MEKSRKARRLEGENGEQFFPEADAGERT